MTMEPFRWARAAHPSQIEPLLYGPALVPGGWLAISLATGQEPGREPVGSLAAFLAQPAESHVVLDPLLTIGNPSDLADAIVEALGRPGLLTLLVPPGTPPAVTGERQGPVRSFVGPASLLGRAPEAPAGLLPETLCFRATWAAFHGTGVGVVARECPARRDGLPAWTPGAGPGDGRGPTSVIMAHRGPPDLLVEALRGLAATDPPPDAIRVGLDVDPEDRDAYRAIAALFPDVAFFAGSRAPVGPYVIRQALAERAPERLLAFHDSDDLSTRDRFHWLHAESARDGAALVGSHELRYDEDDGEIRAVRFPLDVSAALAVAPKHPQLHPTTMLPAAFFHRAGGFSTDCVFGNDTQFMLRAFFHLPLRNVDRFLYIRRDRWESLTNAPETGMANPLRIARNLAWRSDFESIKARRMRLEDSSLAPIEGRDGWTLEPLATPAAPRRE